jgi:hypothetical protein
VGYAQLIGMYSHYRVLWSKIKIRPWSSSDGNVPKIWNVYPSLSSSPFTNVMKASASQAYGKTMMSYYSTTGNKQDSVTNFMASRKIWGDRNDYDSTYGAAATNPAAPWYWMIDAESIDASSNFSTTTEGCFVEISYGVVFEARTNLTN